MNVICRCQSVMQMMPYVATNLETVLQFRYQRALGEEVEESTSPCERHRDDDEHEDQHLRDEEEENLYIMLSVRAFPTQPNEAHETVVQSHDGQLLTLLLPIELNGGCTGATRR